MDSSRIIVTFVLALILSLGFLWTGAEAYAQSPASDIDALIEAAGAGDLKTVRALIEGGVPVDAKDSLGVTALMEASYAGRLPVVKFLLERGADANAKDEAGTSPLLEALGKDNGDAALALIKAGADPNQHDSEERTVVHRAVELGRLDLLNAAVKVGADINTKSKQLNDKDGQLLAYNVTPLAVAVLLENLEAVRTLIAAIKSQDVADATNAFDGPLYWAADIKNKKMVGLLLKAGAQPGSNVMTYAAEADFKLLRRLLKDPAISNKDMLALPLNEAVESKNYKAVSEFLKNGADANGYDDEMYSPIYFAVNGGDTKMVKLLIRAGVDINKKSRHVHHPWIVYAAHDDRADMVKLLANAGADLKLAIKRSHFFTPGGENFQEFHKSPAWIPPQQLLIDVGAPVDDLVVAAIRNEQYSALRRWLPLVKNWGRVEGKVYRVSETYERLVRHADRAEKCALKREIRQMFQRKTGLKPPPPRWYGHCK